MVVRWGRTLAASQSVSQLVSQVISQSASQSVLLAPVTSWCWTSAMVTSFDGTLLWRPGLLYVLRTQSSQRHNPPPVLRNSASEVTFSEPEGSV